MNALRRLTARITVLATIALLSLAGAASAQEADPSVARQWNDLLLEAIRNDFARPTVHGRNLFHTSIAMWDAWAAYDGTAATYLNHERASTEDAAADRAEAISYAAYRVLSARFADSPGAVDTLAALDAKMDDLGYDRAFTDVSGTGPAALGNRIAAAVLAFGAADGANEQDDYENEFYLPVNEPLLPAFPGNPTIVDPNRWQPLALEFFEDQAGNVFPTGTPDFLSPEWGVVTPFALTAADRTVYRRGDDDYVVYHDPGPPPFFGGVGDAEYRAGFEQVVEWSSLLDPSDGVMLDISPGARGNNTLGTNDGSGRAQNPATGQPYAPQMVAAGDYYRVLAEFWADGPDSETPPGHWFVLANYVSDHPALVRRIGGVGPVLGPLEWDVKLYLALGGAVHDSAVAAWGVKGWHDYIRPVSAIRYMADQGQRSDPGQSSYDVDGIALVPDLIEVVTLATIAAGQRHEHLAGPGNENVGKIAVRTWRGPDYIADPDTTTAGVGWILAEDWWPYQRPSFVTPPFAGYVSGHSTFSRAAASVLTAFTGSEYFPGGIGEFVAPQDEFLVFEDGPSATVTLQWATYYDAADECSLSRIYGGIHPRADDIPGRLMGAEIGPDAVAKAQDYFAPRPGIELARAFTRPLRRGAGLITARGRLVTDGNDPDDVLDATNGLTLTVGYGPDVLEAKVLRAGECRTLRGGRIIRGRSADGRLFVRFRRLRKAPEKYAVTIRLRVPEYRDPTDDPLSVRIYDASAVRADTLESCSVHRRRRLRCFQ